MLHLHKSTKLIDWYLSITMIFQTLLLVCAAAQDLPSTGREPGFDAVPGIKTQTARLVNSHLHILLNRHLMATESN